QLEWIPWQHSCAMYATNLSASARVNIKSGASDGMLSVTALPSPHCTLAVSPPAIVMVTRLGAPLVRCESILVAVSPAAETTSWYLGIALFLKAVGFSERKLE